MKKFIMILTVLFMFVSISACNKNVVEENNNETVVEDNQSEVNQNEGNNTEEKVLVVYFSATGTTKKLAETIASITNGDLYEILALEEYTSDDLNWHDSNSRTTHEQNDPSTRPEIASDKLSLDGYTTIYIGYPIWWGEEPRILDTFVESYDFGDIKMIPFCTSSSSGIGRSNKNLEENAGSGNWKEGKRFASGATESELKSWIESID